MDSRESKMLAEMVNEKYIWYPNISEQRIMEKRKMIEQASPNVYVTIYNIEGAGHFDDFKHWKDSMTNRTMTFKRNGFVFFDENIKQLTPTGYIIFVRGYVGESDNIFC